MKATGAAGPRPRDGPRPVAKGREGWAGGRHPPEAVKLAVFFWSGGGLCPAAGPMRAGPETGLCETRCWRRSKRIPPNSSWSWMGAGGVGLAAAPARRSPAARLSRAAAPPTRRRDASVDGPHGPRDATASRGPAAGSRGSRALPIPFSASRGCCARPLPLTGFKGVMAATDESGRLNISGTSA